MHKKYLIILYIIVFCGMLYYIFSIFSDRNTEKSNKNENSHKSTYVNSLQNKTEVQNQKKASKQEMFNESNTQSIQKEKEIKIKEKNNFYINVKSSDCTRECEPYKYDKKELNYCKNVCGLSTTSNAPNTNCDQFNNLEKDYCLKDLAIQNKNFSLCQDIVDIKVQKTCKNRIQEDFLEKSY